ncbi:MAG TPA: hypothetical protein VHX38_17590 [Pseudonocardiaceae bacterium]|nr:hypothetical protein [Pseudonocardiaceae bacterium]
MSVASGLVRLYPSALRARWGQDLVEEANAAGWKSWPNLLVGIADAWLHPAIWPADSRVRRGGRSAAMAVLITVAGWLLAHLTTSSGARSFADLLNGCAALLCLGLLLVAPLPRLNLRAIGRLLVESIRGLALPVLLAAGAVLFVHLHVGVVTGPLLRATVLGCWWGSWALGIVQGTRIIARLGPDLVLPPRPARLRLGIGVLTATTAGAGTTVLGFALTQDRPGPLPAVLAVVLLLSAVASGATLRDLRQLATT